MSIHLKKWEHLGSAKENGGLGFRNLEAFNTALLAKQSWRMLKHPDSLVAQTIRHKYLRNGLLLEAKTGNRPSFLWKSLISSIDLLKEGIFWRLAMAKL